MYSKLVYVAVHVGSVHYGVCVQEITLEFGERQMKYNTLSKMQTHIKLSIHVKIIKHKFGFVEKT